MKLSLTERWILANQYRILAEVSPKQREEYERALEAIERGYAAEYRELTQWFSDELTEAECDHVVTIIAMFDDLNRSYAALEDKTGIDEHALKFKGFDGNHPVEGRQMGYARFFCEKDGGRFTNLIPKNFDFNSHSERTWQYEPMVREYKLIGKRAEMTREEIIRILDAPKKQR